MERKYLTFIKSILVCICIYTLQSCGPSLLFQESKIKSLKYPKTDEHLSIFYSEHFTNTAEGKLFRTTHQLIKIGKNIKSAPDYFSVSDGSYLKLEKFEARLIKQNGDQKTYYLGDLHTVQTSNSNRISDISVKFLPITEIVESGDLLEMVFIHEDKLPPTGIQFSPLNAGNYAVNVECVFEIPLQDSLTFFLANDNKTPEVILNEESKIYRFKWEEFTEETGVSAFKNKNVNPILFATLPRYKNQDDESIDKIGDWTDFGDWYLNLIKPMLQSSAKIKSLAIELTKDKSDAKQKMDAIFQYCQKNIRYEQVYFELGELVPNKCDLVLKRKYGDCKDYSTLMFALAKSVGLESHFALCYRGRGHRFFKQIPVSQFNHAIIHFNFEGVDYWYDGTNRTGIAGITSSDLINQPAFVLEKNNSRFITIQENESNALQIIANLKKDNSDLIGKLIIELDYQFATTFFFLDFYLNEMKMKNFLIDWIKSELNDAVIIRQLTWQSSDHSFKIITDCEISNTALNLNNKTYISFGRLFPNLLPAEDLPQNKKDLFYFNKFNNVKLKLIFENLETIQQNRKILEFEYILPAGPFLESEKIQFYDLYQHLENEFEKKYSFRKVQ